MFIPGGATVIANSRFVRRIGLPEPIADIYDLYWNIHRSITWDENNFHDPHLFKPERFLPKPVGSGEVFPQNAIYGWGRR